MTKNDLVDYYIESQTISQLSTDFNITDLLHPLNRVQGRVWAGAYSSCQWMNGHIRQVTRPSQDKHRDK